jgi:peptidoglycan-associated lipoprotein
MRVTRTFAPIVAVLLLAACAGKGGAVKPTTEIVDAAPAAAPAAPPAEQRDPGACRADADCGDGQTCAEGRCVAPQRCDLARVAFGFDSAQLDARATAALGEAARCVAQRRATAVLVEGHADERGTTAYNLALGSKRAEAVKRYLADLGVTVAIDTVSFGEELPLAKGDGEAAWAENRRAELRLPGDARSDGAKVAGR